MRPKGSPEELEARRQQAMGLLKEGYGPYEIAQKLDVTPWSVYRWKEKMEKGGKEGLRPNSIRTDLVVCL